MYLQELRGEVSQGDIFDSLPLVFARQDGSSLSFARAILLTYDCEYDKPTTKFVMIAEVRPLAEVAPGSQGNVRKNRAFSTFFLDAHSSLAESYVDFRTLSRVEKAAVAARIGQRLASLSDDAQLALQEQLSAFFGYGRGR